MKEGKQISEIAQEINNSPVLDMSEEHKSA
jgi:hypothetical protein